MKYARHKEPKYLQVSALREEKSPLAVKTLKMNQSPMGSNISPMSKIDGSPRTTIFNMTNNKPKFALNLKLTDEIP